MNEDLNQMQAVLDEVRELNENHSLVLEACYGRKSYHKGTLASLDKALDNIQKEME